MWRVIIGMAVPMALAQLVNVAYSIVDRMYIGHIPGVGSYALTGLGLTMPVVSIIAALANLCGMGGGPLCSIARGEGKTDYAEKIMANAFTLLLIIGAAVTVLFLIYMERIIYLFGASEDTYQYAADYARIYILGTLFVMISLGMNSFINAQGFASIGMLTVLLGAAANIILDPAFIFLLDMGIAGAAMATVISQALSAAWALLFLTSRHAILDLRLKNMIPSPRIVGRIIALGVTGFVMNATNGIVQIFCNTQLQKYGGDLYVGAMTVINSVREIVFMLVHGLTSGAQPVLGFNYGARRYDRVRQGIRFVVITGMAYASCTWLIIMLFPRALALVFNNEPELLAVCVPAMRIYFCGFVLMSLQMSGQSVFVGLGKSKQAVFFSLLRKVIIVVPLVLFLPGLGLGVNGVFLSEPISDLIGGLACFVTMYFTVYRRLLRDEANALPQPGAR
ncbi:MAG: MATE family efflux transporter [Butyricicoccus sp.]|nr:MATE family efflux transporter [Butyricicoccus sp.]